MNARRMGFIWISGLITAFGAAGEFAGFAEPAFYPVDFGPDSVLAGDLDGDGDTDLITANSGPGTLSLLFNIENGEFAPVINIPVARSMRDVAITDFDGDGIIDLIAASAGSPLDEPFDAIGRVAILRGLGGGEFGDPVFFFAGTQPVSVAAGDLNGDRAPDFVVSNQLSGNISVFLNDGAGSPLEPQHYLVGNVPLGVVIQDLNLDTYPDIVTANFFSENITLLSNDGNGSFPRVAIVSSPDFTSPTPSIVDINNDGFPEIGLAKGLSENMGVHANFNGAIGEEMLYSIGGPIRNGAFAKINSDRDPDIVATGKFSIGPQSKGPFFAAVAVGDGMGEFNAPPDVTEFSIEQLPQAQCEADFNGDGAIDIATALANSIAVLLNLTTQPVPSDLTDDGVVNSADLVVLLSAWGQPSEADFDNSGSVDGRDLAHLLTNWTIPSARGAPYTQKGELE